MHSSGIRTARSSSRQGRESASVHVGIDPWLWAWSHSGCGPAGPPSQIPLNFSLGCGPGDPPGCGPGNPPLARSPSTSPLGVGLETPPGQIPLNFPLGCGPGDPPPSQIPSNSLLGVGLETCKACWDTTHPLPQRPAARHAGIPPAMHAGIPPPCEQNDRQVQKYYLAPNFVCGR